VKDFFFHPDARDELLEAITYYDRKEPGLGAAFLNEIEEAIQGICDSPQTWPRLGGNIRRCRARRFPYGVLYRSAKEAVEIIAIMHDKRHPDSWKGR